MKVLIIELRRSQMSMRSKVYRKATRGSVTGQRAHSLPKMVHLRYEKHHSRTEGALADLKWSCGRIQCLIMAISSQKGSSSG